MQTLGMPQAILQARPEAACFRSSAPDRALFGQGRRGDVASQGRWEELRGFGKVSWRLVRRIQPRQQTHQGAQRGFALQSQTTQKNVNWILESVGDGDCRHLDEPVPLPDSFELSSDSVIVGRTGGKADFLLNVATVSSLHARLEKKGNALYVTDLNSTNGTYVDNRRVRPGTPTLVAPGDFVTFGDEHLAVFRVAQVEVAQDDEISAGVSTESPTEEKAQDAELSPTE